MTVLDRIYNGVRDVMLLASKVDRLTADMTEVMREVRDQDRRLVRLETMVEMAGRGGGRASRKQLGGD